MSHHHQPKGVAETPEDRKWQEAIAKELAKRWQCRMKKLDQFDTFDYAALPDTDEPFPAILAWVEIKVRKKATTDHTSIFFNADKWADAICRAWGTQLPFLFVVYFTVDKQLWYYTYDHHHDIAVAWAGRTTRGPDDRDVEPVMLVPIQLFQDTSVIPWKGESYEKEESQREATG